MRESRRPNSDPLDEARSSLQQLRAADDWDEPTPVVHVNVHPPATRRSTPPPRELGTAPSSLAGRTPPPPREGVVFVVLRIVGKGVERMPPLGVVLIFALLIAAWVFLAVRGKAPIP